MIVCPYCGADLAVEICGLWIHKFPDRWISCDLKNQERLGRVVEDDQTDNCEPVVIHASFERNMKELTHRLRDWVNTALFWEKPC